MLILVLFMYDSQALVLCRNVKKQANTCNLVPKFCIFAVEIGKKGEEWNVKEGLWYAKSGAWRV